MSCSQSECVVKKIIREIGQECAARGHTVSETLVAFVVSASCVCGVRGYRRLPDRVRVLLSAVKRRGERASGARGTGVSSAGACSWAGQTICKGLISHAVSLKLLN